MYVIVFALPSAGSYLYFFNNVMRISNKVSIIVGPCVLYLKGIYYFIQRTAIEDLILQVSSYKIFLSF